MIRRDTILADGTPGWLLVAQMEHAQLSGELAAAWGNEHVAPVIAQDDGTTPPPLRGVREEVLSAIAHHDDGWREWDDAARIDAENERPYSFLDMPLADALAIWRRSILRCEERVGPLAAWMVAGHFIELRRGSETESLESEAWIGEMQARRDGWLHDWQAASPGWHTTETAEVAMQWLRWFDALSLWLCLDRPEPITLPMDTQMERIPVESVEFRRQETGANDEVPSVRVTPWPFRQDVCRVSVRSVRVRMAERQGAMCLKAESEDAIRWHLQRD